MSYEQAQRYKTALPLERQIHMLLDGAYVYSQSDSYHKVLQIAQQAEALAKSEHDTPVSPIVYARILAVKGGATLWLEMEKIVPDSLVLASVMVNLERARSIYHAHQYYILETEQSSV